MELFDPDVWCLGMWWFGREPLFGHAYFLESADCAMICCDRGVLLIIGVRRKTQEVVVIVYK